MRSVWWNSALRIPSSELTMRIPFTKVVGTGNTFVLVDAIRHRIRLSRNQWAALARVLCAEEQTGTDGLLVLGRSRRADIRMRIFNRDGSEASMCGNGIRCLAWYAHRKRYVRPRLSIETGAGVKHAEILHAGRVRVNMGAPTFLNCLEWPALDGQRKVETDLINSGVPHLVCWVRRLKQFDVQMVGQWLRSHRRFRPAGTNVDFVEELNPAPANGHQRGDRVRGMVIERWTLPMRTYERGIEGETQACGTGAVAAAAALAHLRMPLATEVGRTPDLRRFIVDVRVPGGVLRVEVAGKYVGRRQLVFEDAFLEGAVRQVGQGTLVWSGRGST